MIPFNKPTFLGSELEAIRVALVENGHAAGGGPFGRRCEELLEARLGQRTLLVTSATQALELGAHLLGVGPGDEVIVPSFTFVSTANAFALKGATLRFADVDPDGNLSLAEVDLLLSKKTRCVAPVHYAGNSCDMDGLLERVGSVPVLEDAAQAIGASYRGRPLGTFGACAAISFHETKNIGCGEGGALTIRDGSLVERAEYYRDKGTNRKKFLSGLVDKYSWVDLGSSLVLSDVSAAYLSCQLERLDEVSGRRAVIWRRYEEALAQDLERAGAGYVRPSAANDPNFHLFAIVLRRPEERERFIATMRGHGIVTPFHYVALHSSPFGQRYHDGRSLPNTDRLSSCLVRLPLFFNQTDAQVEEVITRTRELLRGF
ncbi:MAG: dTDP-4-amino-4,6-dideoxygalactose transaminase [Deltaproteobacteria bacterium]|nr:dTDP-4-amino-4,6-dideoxygalactose transaminase [Deltaproteobacteria bacterium]